MLLPHFIQGQDTVKQTREDKIIYVDSITGDTTSGDTIAKDTTGIKAKAASEKKAALKAKVSYSSLDSLRFEIKEQKVFLYNKAVISYEDINLKADFVEINFAKHMFHAKGVPDTTGKDTGEPEFKEGDQTFQSKSMSYNYNTKKGYIKTVFTKQDEGYLHGTVVKKMENNITYIKDGSYTTCERREDPHFEFRFAKGKVIPGKRVITGPAYMEIAGVPTPLAIPFGYFPNRSGRRSGILIPTYGESANRGFFFINGGYYWGISDYMDLYLKGDIYTRGSWAVKPTFNYANRYHYRGSVNFAYSVNLTGTVDAPDFTKKKDFLFQWSHAQDPKARPHSSFSASVNIMSNSYNTNNLVDNATTYLSNQFNSSVNYATTFGNIGTLNLNFSHSQNTLDKTININLPQVAFSLNQFFPFRRKSRIGNMKWYENIGVKYNLDLQNSYTTSDTMLFKPGWQNQMRNGIRHTIPISASFQVLKKIIWTNGININDRMYSQTVRESFIKSPKTGNDSLVTDTIYGFANAFDANFNSTMRTTIFGMYQFKNGPIVAIRHMLTPSVGFSYTPDYGAPVFGYYRYIDNDTNTINQQKYSIFRNGIYGGPPGQKSGLLNFSLVNNLEMKVRNRKDTVTGTKKIMLIENFTISTNYDIAKDSVKWAPISLSAYTTLFKSLKITYGSSWDMYALDALGRRTNKTEWEAHHRFLRLDNTRWDVALNYSLASKKGAKKKVPDKGDSQELKDIMDHYEDYIDFNIPWSFSISYNFSFTKSRANALSRQESLVQTFYFNGQMNITPKWKVNLSTGWDFVHGEISYTNIRIDRDLHCWEMHFNWTPKGAQQQWSFSINVKASILQDLKLDKKKDFRDFGN